MRNDREYEICLAIATYLKLQYPKVLYHFDYAGLHLTKAQAGKMKAIQGQKGYPDLFIMEPMGYYHGCFLEIKKENEKIYRKDSLFPISKHIEEQQDIINKLQWDGYYAEFAIGFDDAKEKIDKYLGLTI